MFEAKLWPTWDKPIVFNFLPFQPLLKLMLTGVLEVRVDIYVNLYLFMHVEMPQVILAVFVRMVWIMP